MSAHYNVAEGVKSAPLYIPGDGLIARLHKARASSAPSARRMPWTAAAQPWARTQGFVSNLILATLALFLALTADVTGWGLSCSM